MYQSSVSRAHLVRVLKERTIHISVREEAKIRTANHSPREVYQGGANRTPNQLIFFEGAQAVSALCHG